MKLQVIGTLVNHYLGRKSQYIHFLAILCLVGILLSTLPVGWDDTQKTVMFFGFPLVLYGQSREETLLSLLGQFFSVAWSVVAIFYLLKLMKKLSESFSVNEMLWLRLTSCSPYEVAIARIGWIISWAFLLSMLGALWALICASFHQISFQELLINVEGLVSHVILSGGIVVALNLIIAPGESEQNSLSFIAWLFPPFILPLLYLGINQVMNKTYMKFFPYSTPFNGSLQNTGFHFGSAALIGFLFLGLHAAFKFRFSQVRVNTGDDKNANLN